MTELERTKMAMAYVAERCILSVETERGIEAILNPPPEIEEVEETVGWGNIYRLPSGRLYVGSSADKETCDSYERDNGNPKVGCQEIKVKVQRPKPPKVERSATVEAWVDYEGDVFGKSGGRVPGYERLAFRDMDEPRERFVTLTATWTE